MNVARAQGEESEQEERISTLLQIQNSQRLMGSVIVLGLARSDSSLLSLRGSSSVDSGGLWPLKLSAGLELGAKSQLAVMMSPVKCLEF